MTKEQYEAARVDIANDDTSIAAALRIHATKKAECDAARDDVNAIIERRNTKLIALLDDITTEFPATDLVE
jgi:hypothetical protein